MTSSGLETSSDDGKNGTSIPQSTNAPSTVPSQSRLFDFIQQAGKAKGPSGSSLKYRTASNGFWVAILLPLAIYISDLEIQQRQSLTAVTIIVANSFLLCVFRQMELNFYMLLQRLRKINIALGLIILIVSIFHGGFVYEIASYVALNFTFPYLCYNLIKQHPRSFSFGEGVLVTSAFAYQFWKASQNLPFPSTDVLIYLQDETIIVTFFLQIVYFGSILAARLLLLLQKPWKLFILEEMLCLWSKYCAMAFFIRVPIYHDETAAFLLMWPFKFLIATELRVRLLLYWAFLSLVTGVFLLAKSYSVRQMPTTIDRKMFHLAVVLVFLPGIFWDTTMIYCCSAVLFYILGLLEIARVLKLETLKIKVGEIIDARVRNFRDRQDEGRLLLTPIYLLVGCASPIWLTGLHKADDEVLKAVQYAASLAGVLSIGIGDTFASIGGTLYGRNHWGNSKKTIEGTISSILAQTIVACLIFMSGVIPYNFVSVAGTFAGILINAIVEGNTDQIDNLVFPLITYITIHLTYFLCVFLFKHDESVALDEDVIR